MMDFNLQLVDLQREKTPVSFAFLRPRIAAVLPFSSSCALRQVLGQQGWKSRAQIQLKQCGGKAYLSRPQPCKSLNRGSVVVFFCCIDHLFFRFAQLDWISSGLRRAVKRSALPRHRTLDMSLSSWSMLITSLSTLSIGWYDDSPPSS